MPFSQYTYHWLHVKKQRHYTASLNQDLFGDWILVKSWGNLHKKGGQVKSIFCHSFNEATKLLAKLEKQQLKKGYKLIG